MVNERGAKLMNNEKEVSIGDATRKLWEAAEHEIGRQKLEILEKIGKAIQSGECRNASFTGSREFCKATSILHQKMLSTQPGMDVAAIMVLVLLGFQKVYLKLYKDKVFVNEDFEPGFSGFEFTEPVVAACAASTNMPAVLKIVEEIKEELK